MSTETAQPDRGPRATSVPAPSLTDPRVAAAVAALADLLALRPAGRKELAVFLLELTRPGPRFAKLPLVSFYAAATRAGGINYRATYRVPGYRTRTERLGRMPKPAYRRAQRVSEVLQQVKARNVKPEDAFRELYVDNTPIDRHVEAFGVHLRTKGVVDAYRRSQVTRIRRCIELGDYGRLGDVRRATLPTLTDKLRAYVEPGKKRPLTPSTINDYLAALRQFVRWAVSTERLATDPLQYTTGIMNDGKKKRRDVLVEELAEIVAAARAGLVPRARMAGDDRAMLYLAAYATGFRRTELRKLQVEWLRLDEAPPVIVLRAGVTRKHRKDVRQPLPGWFAAELKAWLGTRKSGPVWRFLPVDVAGMFDRDREAARTAWVAAGADEAERKSREASDFLRRETTDGEVVFHSHRHAFSTSVVANMDLKSAQRLTRHATAAVLADVYAHSRASGAAEGVERSILEPKRGGGGAPTGKVAPAQGAALSDGL